MRKILMAPIAVIVFVAMYLFDIVRFTILSPLLVFVLPTVLLAIVGALIGLVSGYFWEIHLIAAIVVGIFFFITWPLSQKRAEPETRVLSYVQAFWGSVAGGLTCYFVGGVVD